MELHGPDGKWLKYGYIILGFRGRIGGCMELYGIEGWMNGGTLDLMAIVGGI